MRITAPPSSVAGAAPATVAAPRRRPGRSTGPGTRTLISDADLRRGRNRIIYWTVFALAVVVFLGAFVFPLYWMFASAFKSPKEYALPAPTIVPHSVHPENYSDAWTRLDVAHFFLNTAYYTF